MRHLLLTLTLLFPSLYILAQTPEAPDTVKIIEKADKVLISRTDDTTQVDVTTNKEFGKDLFTYNITVNEADDSYDVDNIEFELPFGIGKEKKKKHSNLQTYIFGIGNIYIGQRFNYYDKGKVKNSLEAGFRDLIGMRWSRGANTPSFSIGLGIGFQRYHAQDGFMFSRIGSNLVVVPVEEGYQVKSTSLYVMNFQVPLLFTLPIGRDVKFTAGGIGVFNTHAYAQTEITNGTSKIKTTYKGLQQRLFTAEVMCSLGVCDILGIYASWSPMTLFKSPYGPQLKSWSIGATVNF